MIARANLYELTGIPTEIGMTDATTVAQGDATDLYLEGKENGLLERVATSNALLAKLTDIHEDTDATLFDIFFFTPYQGEEEEMSDEDYLLQTHRAVAVMARNGLVSFLDPTAGDETTALQEFDIYLDEVVRSGTQIYVRTNGYVVKNGLRTADSPKVVVKGLVAGVSQANLRRDADENATSFATVPAGTELDIVGEAYDADGDKWYKTSYNGFKGYVSAFYIESIEEADAYPVIIDPTAFDDAEIITNMSQLVTLAQAGDITTDFDAFGAPVAATFGKPILIQEQDGIAAGIYEGTTVRVKGGEAFNMMALDLA